MSFDTEPEVRYLGYHPESDCVFETYDGSVFQHDGVCDVTDVPEYEQRFRKQEGK